MATDPHPRPGAPSYAGSDEEEGARLSIGALSRATGIPIETLRTWEARYGFPSPERKPSGHRLYPIACVGRLKRMSEAIARGHRASTVVRSTDAHLADLLASTRSTADARYDAVALSSDDLRAYLDAVVAFDGDRLTGLLRADRARLDLMAFLHARLIPLVRHVGEAWHAGSLHVRHEHFFTEHVEDELRAWRASLAPDASGPVFVFATLPGESHDLGLQMAALVVGASRCRVLYLGTDTPVREIADVAADVHARAVAVSVSGAGDRPSVERHLGALWAALPRRVTLVVGGGGAAEVTGELAVTRFDDLGALADWAANVAA